MKPIGKTEARSILAQLEAARKAATMETASFHVGDFPMGTDGGFTELVKRKTLLYRETWIIAPLDAAINVLRARIRS